MIIEAVKTEQGFLIPFTDKFRNIQKDKILLDIEFAEYNESENDYSALDGLIGLCETEITDASVNHDKIIYGK